MARNRSVDLLPEIFKTDTNKEFLSSTLDQLTQQPKLRQTQGFVGRKFGAGIESDDSYVVEPTIERSNYQLEPGVIFTDDENEIDTAITYPELLDALKTRGADVSRHDRLFSAPVYSWSPLIDFDKFVNHSQYYWIPSGPDSVDVSSTTLMLTDNFDILRSETYGLSGVSGSNPTISLVRGGEYTFTTNQEGHNFYIQSTPGTSGVLPHASNISSRDVVGVSNNGEDKGVVKFTVPETTHQQFYYDLAEAADVDLATLSRFDSINGKLLSQLKNIDGITDLEGKTIVFLDTTSGDSADLGWQYLNLHEDAPFESDPFEETTFIDTQSDRYSVYQIEYVTTNDKVVIKLNKIRSVTNLEKFEILYGEMYSSKSFYKNSSGFFQTVPLLTAAQDTLYYQDATDEDKFGIINLVDSIDTTVLNITDILDKQTYISPNGVEFTNGLKVIFRGSVNPISYQDQEYYVEGVGSSMVLVSVSDLITPETYTTSELEPFDAYSFDSTNFDGNLNSPSKLDFITINRASNDLNPWSRSNRWVHKDVINKTAKYNNTVALFDNDFRANRPIIEFHSNIRLYNFGTESKTPITVIDFVETDALSNINGSLNFSVDGFNITNGVRIVFANDNDINVRNKIYKVNFVDLDGNGILSAELTEAEDSVVLVDQNVVCTNGSTLQGKSYHFNGTEWSLSQQKSSINQSPLFDVYDINGLSLSNTTAYPKSTFTGTNMFSYAIGTGNKDSVLGFPLKFLNIDNLGDIVFNNDLYTDTFQYNTPLVTEKISGGYIRKYTSRTLFDSEIGWTKSAHNTQQEQVFGFVYDGTSLILNIVPTTGLSVPTIKVYIENQFINPNKYTITVSGSTTTIVFLNSIVTGTDIKVTIISETKSDIGYYSVPKNLVNNVFNENSDTLTLGTIRNHYTNLSQNLLNLVGDVNGSNNSRDLGHIERYGDTIVQHSSPLTPMAKFLHSDEFDFFDSLEYNANEYEKVKHKLVEYVLRTDTYGLPVSVILDNALESINSGKGITSPFYKSDMLVGTSTPTITTYIVTGISTDTFNIVNIHNLTKANNTAILVYVNDVILTRGTEYTVSTNSPTITITSTLTTNDVVVIKEFNTTNGSYVPNTPTKLGLYPKYIPSKYIDDTYLTPVSVIKGHDGSITTAFNDIRDDVLLEFEIRIYNNIKINSTIPITTVDVMPGKFRTTDYSDSEVTNILSTSFLNWVGWNRLDYKTQNFITSEDTTWNFSTSSSKLDGTSLKGHWRGVYKDYYDTDTPHKTPWEMLGFSEKPLWWESVYGSAPYTNGNLVLWGDLETGTIKEPGNTRVDSRYVRTGLTSVIPVDSEGKLLSPFISIVQDYTRVDFQKSWVFGDQSPTESAWRKSSTYPFALQRLFALTKPAQYFALSIDRDRYRFNVTMNQYVFDSRHRLDSREVDVQTNTNPKHSYINWIADYHNNNGCDCVDIKEQLSNMDIRLCYRMAAFTDKNYLKIFTDKSSPDSLNTGLLLPDQSYDLILHKNQSVGEIVYSSVVVQKTDKGYSIHGHSKTQQYFEIYQSIHSNKATKIFTNKVTLVPYGYVFTTKDGIVDFLVSYGAFLESNGMIFSSTENSNTLNWDRMTAEFLSWASQDWGVGSIVNLNPGAYALEFNKELVVVDNINDNNTQVLDQNGLPLTSNDYVITRLDNSFKVSCINNKTINLMKIKSTSYEHLLVIDNTSIFNDLLYKPVTGLRQQRIRLVGFTTFEWNGQLDAQGFILNQDNVKEWQSNKFYTTGSIVKFKNKFWSAVKRLNPSEIFNFNEWSEINYNDINKGLLPNLSNKASQITEYYNKKTSNLETDVDLLAMGLIGFRPRSYLNSLDDTSQVNFYSGFVDKKGTRTSLNSFKNIKFDKKLTDYEIFENWAIRESTYGNSSNKAFIEFELQGSKLQNNPSTVEIINDSETVSNNHQIIKVSDVYKQSETHLSKNIFPIKDSESTDVNLPTAGHVVTTDVDIALFKLSDLNGAAGVPFITDLSSGSMIWVAKANDYDWDVYRADIQSNILSILPVDNELEITFYFEHNFVVNDTIVLQGISLLVNGGYGVENIVNSKTIRVSGSIDTAFVNIASDNVLTVDSTLYTTDHKLGFVYKLVSLRASTITNLSDTYNDQLPLGARVWVDNNDNDKHAVYQKYKAEGNVTSDSISATSDTTVYTADGYGVWKLLREDPSEVDTALIDKVIMYHKDPDQATHYLDYIDPLSGKILGVVDENINYTSGMDPATYNQTTNVTGVVWGEEYVGTIWWDTSNTRFLDYNQTDLNYSSKNWGHLFPGSTADIRQWVKSNNHPTQYTGPGTVVDVSMFTTVSSINTVNTIVQHYYFWVTNLSTVAENKTLSVNVIEQYIKNPLTSGIEFVAFLNSSTVSLYNVSHIAVDSVLHISYKHTYNENDVFTEYSLIKENNKNDFLSDNLYTKLQDSFVGGNIIGLSVPDNKLNVVQKLGINYRPRQTMFTNRFRALKEYLTQVNSVIKTHIVTTNRNFDLLKTAEPIPSVSTNKWDLSLATLSELNYQNLDIVATGYKYLVQTDSNNNGGWSIYEVIAGPKLQLIQIQKFDTSRLWSYIDWYSDDNARQAIPQYIVTDSSKLSTLNVVNGTYVKVTSNTNGKFEIYQLTDDFWIRVGLENGTIEFNKSLWSSYSTQDSITCDTGTFTIDSIITTADVSVGGSGLRNVIKSINEDLFVDEILIERNKLLITMFNYILAEQGNVDWLHKTSLVDVEHKVRDLEQYTTYKKDDQNFLLDYLTESKPYHTKIKEFLLKYDSSDQYNTDIADFDVPVYFDNTFNKFISPVLDYKDVILTSDQSNVDDDGVGLTNPDYNIWKLTPWNNWYNNRTLTIKSVTIVNNGVGYTTTPTITVTGGGATTQATLSARINNSGQVIDVVVVDGGAGYTTTPTITVTGGNGLNAVVIPIVENALVRTLNTTIKYDRYEYTTSVVNWLSNSLIAADSKNKTSDDTTLTIDSLATVYDTNQLVRYNDLVYKLNETRAFKQTFDITDYTKVDPSTLSSIDRISGYYTPKTNSPGLDLALLVNGIDYPGVVVRDLDFNDSAGFSVVPFDTEPFDVIEIDDDGSAKYSEGVLDTEYKSSFNNQYLGTRPEDINADGGGFVDTYSSHSPEELIPGSAFDTLSLLVHTRPGFDYQGNGHVFETQYVLYEYSPTLTTFSFNKVVAHPVTIKVVNTTTHTTLHIDTDYTVDWVGKTINVINNVFDGDSIQIFVYEIGGGNQLYRTTHIGNGLAKSLTIPVESRSIYDIIILVNGKQLTTGFTSTADGAITVDSLLETTDSTTLTVDRVSLVESQTTTISFVETYTSTDFISITVFGHESTQYEYTYPIVTCFTPYGTDSTMYTTDSTTLSTDIISVDYNLSDVSLSGTNKQNAIVEHNGKRLRPPEAKRYTGDSIETDFRLPVIGGINHSLVSSSEVVVFVNNVKQILSTDYIIVTVVVGIDTFKDVRFTSVPSAGHVVDIYVTSIADYTINNSILNVNPHITVSGLDKLCVTTWNDTSQLDLLTSSFKGPSTVTSAVVDLFDASGFDRVGFDFVGTSSNDMNLFELGRTVDVGYNLWVTLNNGVLLTDVDYSVSGSLLLLAGDLISPTDIVSVTSMSSNVVPDALSFRIFKDMNGSSAMYKVSTCCLNRVELTQNLDPTNDTIYVNDISNLTIPNLELGTFGIVMINNERITYRSIDSGTNSISGLRRGTAGTSITQHTKETIVHDVSITNVVTGSVITSNTLGADTNTVTSNYDGIWYKEGNSTVSDGIALQNQTTPQANFVKTR